MFYAHVCWGQGGISQIYCLALHPKGVPVSSLSLAWGRCAPDGQDEKEYSLMYPKILKTKIEWPVSTDMFGRWPSPPNFSVSCLSGERMQIEGLMFDGGCKVWKENRAKADCFQRFVKFGLEVKDSKGPNPSFCLNGISLYQLLLEAWPDSYNVLPSYYFFLNSGPEGRKRSTWPFREFNSLLGSTAQTLCSPRATAQCLLFIIL